MQGVSQSQASKVGLHLYVCKMSLSYNNLQHHTQKERKVILHYCFCIQVKAFQVKNKNFCFFKKWSEIGEDTARFSVKMKPSDDAYRCEPRPKYAMKICPLKLHSA